MVVVCRKVRARTEAAVPGEWPAAAGLGPRLATGRGAQNTGKQLVPPALRCLCAHSPYQLKKKEIG